MSDRNMRNPTGESEARSCGWGLVPGEKNPEDFLYSSAIDYAGFPAT